jgi:hypothetical protein
MLLPTKKELLGLFGEPPIPSPLRVDGKDGKDGANGIDGLQGVSVVDARMDIDNSLVLVLSSGREIDCGEISPAESKAWVALKQTQGSSRDRIDFNTTLVNPPHVEGVLFYDNIDKSLTYYNEDPDVAVNIGRELLVRVFNATGALITNGSCVSASGTIGTVPGIIKAVASSASNTSSILGLATSDIGIAEFGYVCALGVVNQFNTSAYTAGTVLYLSGTTSGGLTNIRPLQPNYVVEMCTVIVSGVAGSILVRVDKKAWFPSLELLETVASITLPLTPTVFKPSVVAYNDGFTYDSLTGILTTSVSSSYGLSIVFNAVPPAANKHIYFYAEVDKGAGWVIDKYSARDLLLTVSTETAVVISANNYYALNTKIRYYIWADSAVSLQTVNLPGTTPGTAAVPAFKLQIS